MLIKREKNWTPVLDHIAQGRVKIINPPAAFLMQNKSVLALIWQLYEEEVFFEEEERGIIQNYFYRHILQINRL